MEFGVQVQSPEYCQASSIDGVRTTAADTLVLPAAMFEIRLGYKKHATQMMVGAENVVAFEEPIIERQITGYARGEDIRLCRDS